MSELLIDGKENFECAYCHKIFDCDDAVKLKDKRMKLIIDIPEEIYEASQIIDVKYEDVIQIPLEVIANGTPVEEEFEKIREEIQNLIDFNESCEGHTDLYQADELIKERIAKLKGK